MTRIISQGPGRLLGAAGVPVRAHDAGGWQGRGLIFGSPGVTAIPAPAPPVPQSWNRALHRSSDAPNWFRPSVYYLHGKQAATPPISVGSDNQMPVPAVDPRGKPAVMSFRPQFLGQQQIVQPVALPRWRNRGG